MLDWVLDQRSSLAIFRCISHQPPNLRKARNPNKANLASHFPAHQMHQPTNQPHSTLVVQRSSNKASAHHPTCPPRPPRPPRLPFYAPPFEARVYHLQLPCDPRLHCPFFPSCIIHLTRLVALSTTKHQGNFLFLFSPPFPSSLILSFLAVLCSLQSSKYCVHRISTLFCFPIRPPSLSAPLGSLSHRDGESQHSPSKHTPTQKTSVLDRRLGVPPQSNRNPDQQTVVIDAIGLVVGFSCKTFFQEWRPSPNRML